MAQYLKDETQQNILRAAQHIFARRGFEKATMAEIAKVAKISTGNIYRYYENKEILFQEAIPPESKERLEALLRQRVGALQWVRDLTSLAPSAPFYLVSEELMRFSIEQRWQVIFLLGNAHGTAYASFADELVEALSALSIAHFRFLQPALQLSDTLPLTLSILYRNFLAAMVSLLEKLHQESKFRQAIGGYSRYHLAGLQALFR
jgi:AcrR family transcriptional regulator